jgi:hypothetical protein
MDATAGNKQVDLLAERWYEACEERRIPFDGYQSLRVSLRQFLPSSALAGLGFPESEEDPPFVIGLTDGVLLRFTAPDSESMLNARALLLESIIGMQVRGTETSSVRAHLRVGHWSVAVSGGNDWNIRTLTPFGAGFGTENGGELVMLTLAEKLGWPTPLKGKLAS